MAATQGLVAMLWVNAVHGLNVAPWGGSGGRLGTNPHAIGIPGAAGPAMVLDFATSVVAEGRMRVKKNRKQQAPLGWFIDAEGRPATDPEIFYGDRVASLLTAGRCARGGRDLESDRASGRRARRPLKSSGEETFDVLVGDLLGDVGWELLEEFPGLACHAHHLLPA